ncbi:MAG: VWA domain-containing protein [Hyphomicrobium sp.]|nr:VWA domain-containing protein [Hyphomicrobium sp.]
MRETFHSTAEARPSRAGGASWRRVLQIWHEDAGGIMVPFAVIALVLVAISGGVVDVAVAINERTRLQSALDAATLAVAVRSRKDEETDVDELGTRVFSETWSSRMDLTDAQTTFSKDEDGQILAEAQLDVPTKFLPLIGIDKLPAQVESVALKARTTAEIALVVDNTWSMSGPKIEALREAASRLVDIVFEGSERVSEDERPKIAVVPFSQYVNVGLGNRSASWLSVEDDSRRVGNEVCDWHQPTRCVRTERRTTTSYIDGVPQTGTRDVCVESVPNGPRQWRCNTPTSNRRWSGCVGSRDNPFDTRSDVGPGRLIPGLMNVTACPRPITPLTSDKDAVLSEIESLNVTTANSETYTQPGVLWGWYALTNEAPFDQGVVKGTQGIRKVMVFMTDGANTRGPSYPAHTRDARASTAHRRTANSLTVDTCANAKADGIEIFSVAFSVSDPETIEMIRNCASDPSRFMTADDPEGLLTTFETIADQITELHISQ